MKKFFTLEECVDASLFTLSRGRRKRRSMQRQRAIKGDTRPMARVGNGTRKEAVNNPRFQGTRY